MKELKVLNLVHEKFEDLELWYPAIRLREEGVNVLFAGNQRDEIYYGKNGVPAKADISFDEVKPEEFDGLLIPGGWAPDKLRRIKKVLDITKEIYNAEKPIGMICHAGWVPISAGILKGKRLTSVSAIKDDLINAGALWEDNEVVVDNNLVSSRTPKDLHIYMKEFINLLPKNL